MVGDDAIDLLGHRAIEGAQSRFDVAEGDPLFRGNERDGRRRVDVSSDEDDVGSVLPADLLERRHDPGGLAGVRVGADLEVDVGPRHAELIEEDARHVLVVVLTGVDEEVRDPSPEDLLHDGGHLHEIGPRAHDAQDLHAAAPSRRSMKRPAIPTRSNSRSAAARPAPPRAARRERIGGEAADGGRQPFRVSGRGDDSGARALDDLRRLPSRDQHDGHSGAHRLVDLGGHRARERDFQRHQGQVGGRDQRRHLLPRHGIQEADVGQAELAGAGLERRLDRSVPDEGKGHGRDVAQSRGGLEDLVEALGDAVQTAVERDAGRVGPPVHETRADVGGSQLGTEQLGVDPVGEMVDVRFGKTLPDVFQDLPALAGHEPGFPVAERLQGPRDSEPPPLGDSAELDRALGPQIRDVEYPARAGAPSQQVARDPEKERRALGQQEVETGQRRGADEERAPHEREVRGQARREPDLVGRIEGARGSQTRRRESLSVRNRRSPETPFRGDSSASRSGRRHRARGARIARPGGTAAPGGRPSRGGSTE